MPIYPTLTQIAQVSALGIFSGPQASFASAQAIVSRLKRGQEWANKRLPGVIGRFAEFSPVEVSLPLVERRSSMRLWAQFAEDWGVQLHSAPRILTARGALGVLARRSLSVSGPNGGVACIVAPNVLEAGIRGK